MMTLREPLKRCLTAMSTLTIALVTMTVMIAGEMPAQGVTLAAWETDGLSGYGPNPYAPTTTDSNVIVGGLTRSGGIGTGGNAAGNVWGGTSFTVGGTLDTAVANDEFITFTVAPAAGQAVSFSSISETFRRSSTGPSTFQWQFDIGSGFTNIGSAFDFTSTTSNGAAQPAIDLSGVAALQNVETTVTFRLLIAGATNSGGTWGFGRLAGDDLIIDGTTAAGGGTGNGGGDPDPTPGPTPTPGLTAIAADGIIGANNMAPLLAAGQTPAPNAFSAASDGFQIYQRGVSTTIPFATLDDSLSIFTGDRLGIVGESDTTAFFGVTDLVNPDNNSGNGVAEFQFDITGLANIQIAIDMAAMGDFETANDSFNFAYSIDGGEFQDLFLSTVDEAISQLYTLEGGASFDLADPLFMNGVMLSNLFQTLTADVTGIGTLLTLRFSATTDGGEEVFAFRNIEVTGTGAIPEPGMVSLALLGLCGLALRRRRAMA